MALDISLISSLLATLKTHSFLLGIKLYFLKFHDELLNHNSIETKFIAIYKEQCLLFIKLKYHLNKSPDSFLHFLKNPTIGITMSQREKNENPRNSPRAPKV